MLRRAFRTYVVSVGLLSVLGLGSLILVSFLTALRSGGFLQGPRPPADARIAYDLEVIPGESRAPTVLHIDSQGAACRELEAPPSTTHVCELATYVDPVTIASQAFGRINYEDTDALNALLWRARMNSDARVCISGGLTGIRLAKCRDAVAAESFQVKAGQSVLIVLRGIYADGSP